MAKRRSLHLLRRGLLRGSESQLPDSTPRTPLGGRQSRRRPSRLEVAAWASGVGLLAFAGTVKVVGNALKQQEVRSFERAREAVASTAAPSSLRLDALAVNQSLWAEERIHAYARALKEQAPSTLAVLRIPRIGLEGPILPGTDEWTLDRGLGWIAGTARPGELGNVGIAGHRDGFFRGLKDVKPGDAVELTTLSGQQVYRIERIFLVSPDDVGVLSPTSAPALTLVTCFPFYFVGSAPERYVVRAVLSSPQTAAPRAL
jgi:sortase A